MLADRSRPQGYSLTLQHPAEHALSAGMLDAALCDTNAQLTNATRGGGGQRIVPAFCVDDELLVDLNPSARSKEEQTRPPSRNANILLPREDLRRVLCKAHASAGSEVLWGSGFKMYRESQNGKECCMDIHRGRTIHNHADLEALLVLQDVLQFTAQSLRTSYVSP